MRKVFSILVLLGAFWNASASAAIIKNGGFETGDFSDWTVTPLIDTPTSDIKILPFAFGAGFSGNFSAGLGEFPGPDGDILVPSAAWIDLTQNLHTGKGVEYLISFDLGLHSIVGGGAPNGTHVTGIEFPCDILADPGCDVLTVDFGGNQVFQLNDFTYDILLPNFDPNTLSWHFNFLAYAQDRNTVLNLDFFNSDYIIDNISVTPCNSKTCQSGVNNFGLNTDSLIFTDAPIVSAPEPSSWTLMLSGLVAFFMLSLVVKRSRNGLTHS